MNPDVICNSECRAISEDMEIDFSEVEQLVEIGRGSFGVVYRGIWRSKVVAVKKINTAAEQKALMIEVRQLSRVSHPNIIKLYGASTKKPICLVMELAEASLFDVLHCQSKINYTFHHAMNWALQCARGVAYLHGMKPKAIIHRDLKPPNLLLMSEGRVLKICDFGTACDIRTQMTNSQGSAAWMAPEVFEGKNYSEKCDVFSWSIILWELVARQKPFSHMTDSALAIMWAVHMGKRPPLIRGCPLPLEQLMTSCWDQDARKRPSMEQVVKEMSHLFQFFPEEIPPLEYPDQTDMAVDEDPDDLESPSSEPSGTNSSTSSALTRTSFQIPRKDEAVENLLPAFNHTMDLSKTTQEPLHLIIGEVENEDSAEGYAIRPLDNDFLTGNQSTPVNPPVIPRRPQQFHPPIKRRSVELPAAFTPPPPVHPSLPGASAMWSHPSSGHRRSASHGNPTELWGFIGGVAQHQQSMPCISNLEPIRTSGESSTIPAGGEQLKDDIFFLLHPSLRPIPPCPTSQVSMRVYEEHRKMAREYLEVQKELQWMTKYCNELAVALEETKRQQRADELRETTSRRNDGALPPPQPSELQRSVEEFVQLENEKKSLIQLHRNLKEQLNRVRTEQQRQQEQQQQQQPDRSRSPPLPDDGWVVLQRT